MNRGELGRGEVSGDTGRRVIFGPLCPSTVQHRRRQAAAASRLAERRHPFPGVDLAGHGDLDCEEGHVARY